MVAIRIEFQTNSREVEADSRTAILPTLHGFRRTLVRLKPSGAGDLDHPIASFRRTLVRLKRDLAELVGDPGQFQTNSREVEATVLCVLCVFILFQTNSREVEAYSTVPSISSTLGFRRTLVRLKPDRNQAGSIRYAVSDELS